MKFFQKRFISLPLVTVTLFSCFLLGACGKQKSNGTTGGISAPQASPFSKISGKWVPDVANPTGYIVVDDSGLVSGYNNNSAKVASSTQLTMQGDHFVFSNSSDYFKLDTDGRMEYDAAQTTVGFYTRDLP